MDGFFVIWGYCFTRVWFPFNPFKIHLRSFLSIIVHYFQFVHYFCPFILNCPLFCPFFLQMSINTNFQPFFIFLYLNFPLFKTIKNIFIKFSKLILYYWKNPLSNWKIRNKFKCHTILETSDCQIQNRLISITRWRTDAPTTVKELMSIWRPKMPCFEKWENLGRRDWKLIVYWNVMWTLKLCYVSTHGH